MAYHNHNFTGKTMSLRTPRRKFGKVKNNRKHKNKYKRFSLEKKPKYTNGF